MKLLIVTETQSIHAARWVNQLIDTGWEVHVFQAIATNPSLGINPEFKHGTFYLPKILNNGKENKINATLSIDSKINILLDQLNEKIEGLIQRIHEKFLADLIIKIRPDIIHSLGMNINWKNCCLPVLRVLEKINLKIPWLYSTWGTDLDYFPTLSENNKNIVTCILKNCDYLITECIRDKHLAEQMGFKGKFLDFFTGFGGVDDNLVNSYNSLTKTSSRKTILLKGRAIQDGDQIGRALTAMEAFKLCEDILKEFRIVINTSSYANAIINKAAILNATTNLKIQILPFLPYELLLEVYKSARIFISLTINDGIPSSLIEAMTFGAFPIHSNIESISEIIKNGENGFLVPSEDTNAVSNCIIKAVSDNDLVDKAANLNIGIVKSTYSEKIVKPKVIKMYNEILKNGSSEVKKKVSNCVAINRNSCFSKFIIRIISSNEYHKFQKINLFYKVNILKIINKIIKE